MPIKNGPYGTTRYYDASNGRYCKYSVDNSFNEFLNNFKNSKHTEIYIKASNSKDKNLFEVYSLLEELKPGCVLDVNCTIFDKNIHAYREIDIITCKAIIEVKSGKAKHHTKQFLSQLKLASTMNKDYILFTPGSGNHQIEFLKKLGIIVVKNLEELEKIIRSKKCKI